MGRRKKLKEALPGLWRTFRYFWPRIRCLRGLIAGSSLALVASTLLRLAEPWPLKFIFDRLIPLGPLQETARIASLDVASLLALSALILFVIYGLRACLEYLSTMGFARVGNRVLREVRDDLYRHVQRLSLSFHDRARGGDLIMRLIRDVGLLRDVAGTAVLPMLANTLLLAGMIGVLFWMQWSLALLALSIVPLYWLVAARLGRHIKQAAREQRRREGAMASAAAESITAIKVVQALSLEERFAQQFASGNKHSQKQDLRVARLSARLERSVDVLLGLGTALVLWYGATLVIGGRLSPGDLVVFLTYLRRAFNPARDFAKYSSRLAKASAAGERVIELFTQQPEVRQLPSARPAPRFAGAIEFEQVTFAYEPSRPVLRRFDCCVPAGCQLAVVGPSGIGKSSLLSLVLRLYDPWEGRVLIDGQDIRDFTLRSLRAQISAVLQESLLFAASFAENIAVGAPGASREEIEAAARLANAAEFIERSPQGYDTLVGERGVTLSHGQRQRIAIARAALRQSPILLLDEPTTGLDEDNQRQVVAALDRLRGGCTTLVATHDLEMASRADLILYLDNGHLVELGTHEELLLRDGRYAAMYRLQQDALNGSPRRQPTPSLAIP